jgi:nucleoid-associated protein YgaU
MAPAPASRRGFPISALPPAVRPRSISPFVPDATARLNQVTIRPGDSLWKIAAQNLGEARRWHELLALNPAILNSNYIVAGTRLYLPATSVVASNRTPKKFTVHRGDTLSQIAQSRLGHASYAACIAQANPSIHDLNRIYAGQSLILPAMCKP